VEKMGSSQSALNFGAGPAKLPREVIMPIKKKIVGGIAVIGYNYNSTFCDIHTPKIYSHMLIVKTSEDKKK
jgi:hypothetical protein